MATEPVDKKEQDARDLAQALIEYELNRSPAKVDFSLEDKAARAAGRMLPPLKPSAPLEFTPTLSEDEKAEIAKIQSQAATGQLPPVGTERLKQIVDTLSSQLEQKRKPIEEKREGRIQQAKAEFEKAKRQEMEPNEIIARSIIALAPALIGKLAAGSMGGAAGGQVGVTTLSELERLRQQQQQQQMKIAEEYLQSATQFGKGELENIEKMQAKLLEAPLEAELGTLKTEQLAQIQALRDLTPKQLKEMEQRRQAELKKAEMAFKEKQLQAQREAKKADLQLKMMEDRIQGAGKGSKTDKEKGPTQKQVEMAGFARRMELALNDLQNIENQGFNRASYGSASEAKFVPDIWKSQPFKQYYNAELAFINAVKRRESGAAVKDSEHEEYAKLYFPRAGDGPNVINEKNNRRQQKLVEMQAQAGKALELVPLVVQKAPKLTPEIYNKMSDQEKIEYKSATPGRRSEILKQVEGR